MFSILYKFEVKLNQDLIFKESWKKLTLLFYKHGGSLGSRLHKANDNVYIAYAQWPSREVWDKAVEQLPELADEVRDTMRASCVNVEVLYKLDCVEDLLKNEPSS